MIENSPYTKMNSSTGNISSTTDSVKSSAQDYATEFASNAVSKAKDIGGQVMDRLGTLPGVSRQYAGRIDASARANPWLHIGLVSVGALAIGYFVGRRLAVMAKDAEVSGLGEIYNH